MISFEHIKDMQMRFMDLRHIQIDIQSPVMSPTLNEQDIEDLIYVLGQLLYFMHMTNREEI